MKLMLAKRLLLAIVLALPFCPTITAAEKFDITPNKDRLIAELSAMHTASDLAKGVGVTMAESYLQALAKAGMKVDSKMESQVRELMEWAVVDIAEEFGIVEQYNSEVWGNFSESELQELIDFYRTPVGSKLAKASPDLMTEFIKVSLMQDPTFSDAVNKRAVKLLKALKSAKSIKIPKAEDRHVFKKKVAKRRGFKNMIASNDFWTEVESYSAGKTHKALAVATSAGGEWSMGWAISHRTKKDAIDVALANCQPRRAKFKIPEACWVLFDGHQVTGKVTRSDLPKKRMKVFSGLDLDELSDYERLIEDFKALKDHKALSITEKEDGAYYLYYSYGYPDPQAAIDSANASCEENKPNAFTGDCRILMQNDEWID